MAACQTVQSEPVRPLGRDLVFLQLKSGPRSAQISKEEAQKVFAGHFANMERLAAEGQLLLAGPYGAPKRDPELRGVFVLDTPDTACAQALAATDPGVIAGVFRTECVRMRTRAPLDAYIAHEMALEAQRKAEGHVSKPGEFGRPFVLLTAEDGRRARQALLDMPGVLLWGEFEDGRALALLDAKDLEACTRLLGDRVQRMGPYVMDPWFGSQELVKLPEMAREAAVH